MDYNSPRFSTIFLMICLLCCYKLNMDRINISPLCFNETSTKPEILMLQVPGVSFLVLQIRNLKVLIFHGMLWGAEPQVSPVDSPEKQEVCGFFVCAADGWAGVRCTFLDLSFNITVPFYARLFCSLFVFWKARLENLSHDKVYNVYNKKLELIQKVYPKSLIKQMTWG